MVLNKAPTANVTVTPTSSDTEEATVSEALTFTNDNWAEARTVTVTGVDDDAIVLAGHTRDHQSHRQQDRRLHQRDRLQRGRHP